MTRPLVSVGMPVYNGGRYLGQALDSILSQTFENFELIISDNGSQDDTEAISRERAGRDPRIRYERAPRNRGASWNFNNVVYRARGTYFKWASHDDLCAPTFLERCVETLEQHPEAVIAYPKAVLVDENGEPLEIYPDRLDVRSPDPRARFVHVARKIGLANVIFGLIRTERLMTTRLLGAYPSADLVLLGELALLGTFVQVDEPLFLRRVHPQMSRRANVTPKQVTAWFDPARKVRAPTEGWRLLVEYLRAIERSSLPPGEKLMTVASFLGMWVPRNLPELSAEAVDATAALLRGQRA